MAITITGLERFLSDNDLKKSIKGNIGLLAHNASVTKNIEWAPLLLKQAFGDRLTTLFGPQHGMFASVQDNMIETEDFYHPSLGLTVYSLYGKTRRPTEKMLQGLNTILVDLQDVGTRVYTYLYTLSYLMEECGKRDIEVVVLDRPNPAGGDIVEGNLLDLNFTSFVGRHQLPMRHGLTLGEFALWAQKFIPIHCRLRVITMDEWSRRKTFNECGLPWVNPSPNLSHPDSAFCYPGTILFEGTSLSEGRGTTRALEVIGHPDIDPFAVQESWNWKKNKELHDLFSVTESQGLPFALRPHFFIPTFHKFQGENCGGWQIHTLDPHHFQSWRLGQWMLNKLYHLLGEKFSWKQPPYEYEFNRLPIDMINGTDKLRLWIEKGGPTEELLLIEKEMETIFLPQREQILLYRNSKN